MKTILIVEDDVHILEANTVFLTHKGYNVKTASTVKNAKKIIFSENIDLIIMDVLLPDGNGIELCKEIRPKISIPVIFLTCLADDAEVIKGLNFGGDDYITKPYNMEELSARCASMLRRVHMDKKTVPRIIERGPLVLDLQKSEVYLFGEDIGLTPKEYSLFLFMVENEGRLFTPEKLYMEIWGQSPVDAARIIQVHISNIRKKLKQDIQSKVEIIMVKRKSYTIYIEE